MRFYDLTKLAVLTFFVTLASPSVYGPVAFATQPPMQSQTILQDFSESAKTLPRKLLLQGHAKIGDIELDDLLTVFDSVHLAVTSTVAHRQTMGGEFKMERDSAEWHRAYSDSSIHINGPM